MNEISKLSRSLCIFMRLNKAGCQEQYGRHVTCPCSMPVSIVHIRLSSWSADPCAVQFAEHFVRANVQFLVNIE